MEIILASASPRRQELMHRITSDFKTVISNFNEETINYSGNPCDYVTKLSASKAEAVADSVAVEDIVIGADTVVVLDNIVLGKPKDKEDAYKMLMALSGQWHEVFTGVTVLCKKSERIDSQCVGTKVKFSTLTHEDVLAYLEREDYMSYAGSYGIQGSAGVFVEQIIGDYFNIVGLPINKLNCMLKSFL